ncbi:MAG TPA: GNAT family N-acetyltransferase [Candidatus Monoglobus merdigallinarum]|uniref:GNAT family N-acetyltransferase n=1 Tax=Candidatus Monoglobus merdigallinarum TaxID=2838698 RepID=A0A9D1PR68_9FIRM|nr:GNAT family N-acetyltransferase [Candidatus Monoglobus merdigallinarum]
MNELKISLTKLKPGDKFFDEAYALYKASFPECERRSSESFLKTFEDERFRPYLILSGGEFAGVFFCWDFGGLEYLEHFAVDPGLRGSGIGAEALKNFAAVCKCLMLEIEAPYDELSLRRKRFYERCGFTENPYVHNPPPYIKGRPQPELMVMSYGGAVSRELFSRFEVCVADVVSAYRD